MVDGCHVIARCHGLLLDAVLGYPDIFFRAVSVEWLDLKMHPMGAVVSMHRKGEGIISCSGNIMTQSSRTSCCQWLQSVILLKLPVLIAVN